MTSNSEKEYDFKLKDIKIKYHRNLKEFICDQIDILQLLRNSSPQKYKRISEKYPELKDQKIDIIEERSIKSYENNDGSNICFLSKETKDMEIQVNDGKDATENLPIKIKQGMMSNISRGLRKILTTLTPKKLRKKWNLEEESSKKENSEKKN